MWGFLFFVAVLGLPMLAADWVIRNHGIDGVILLLLSAVFLRVMSMRRD